LTGGATVERRIPPKDSPEDVERFGVILRAKFPTHFVGASKRAHASISNE